MQVVSSWKETHTPGGKKAKNRRTAVTTLQPKVEREHEREPTPMFIEELMDAGAWQKTRPDERQQQHNRALARDVNRRSTVAIGGSQAALGTPLAANTPGSPARTNEPPWMQGRRGLIRDSSFVS